MPGDEDSALSSDQFSGSGWGCRNTFRGDMYVLISLLLILIHLIVLPVYVYLTWNHGYWRKRGLVTAKPLTLLGTYPGLLTRRSNLVEDIQPIYNKYKGKLRAVGVFVTREPQILVLDPQLAHEVLVQNFRCYRDSLTSSYMRHAKWDKYVGRNPFWASGDTWRRLRSEAQAGLTINRLKQGFAIWQESGKKLNDFMAHQTSTTLETRDLCFRYAADVMSDFIWGIEAGTLEPHVERGKQLQDVASKWTSHTFYMISIFMATMVAPFTRRWLRLRFYPKETDEFFSRLTQHALDMRLKSQQESPRMDFLSYLVKLRNEKQASHDDLVGHALTVLLDGYDTTATALLHALYYLSEAPDVQQKLRKELLSQGDLNFDELCELPYLEQVVYESLRLSSLIPQYTKVCTDATHIQLSETKQLAVEVGMTIMIPNYQFHHDAKYFPEPSIFRPERFDNGAHHDLIRQGILLPFSDGPRICIGMRLALLTLKSALYHIVRNYQIFPSKQPINISGDSGFGVVLQGDINLEYRRLSK